MISGYCRISCKDIENFYFLTQLGKEKGGFLFFFFCEGGGGIQPTPAPAVYEVYDSVSVK